MNPIMKIIFVVIFISPIILAQEIKKNENHYPKFIPYAVETDTIINNFNLMEIDNLGKEQPARWLAVDRLADKYPGWSPYNYTINNPLRFIDPNGDSLDLTGNQQKALSYLQSMIDSKYSNRISVGTNGRVSFDTKGLDLSKNIELALLNNIVNGSSKFLFEVLQSNSNVQGVLRSSTALGQAGDIISSPFDGVANYSVTPRNANGGTGATGLLPRNGYDGQVALGEGSYNFLDGTPQPVSNVVFHELSENYHRTVGGYPYRYSDSDPRVGAHYRAIIDATQYHKQIFPAGQGSYVK